MKRFVYVLPLVLGAAAHAELIEYTVSGNGTLMYEANDSNSVATGSWWGGREWTADYSRIAETSYTYRFYADTDNVVSDGNGGFYVPIEAFHYQFADGTVGEIHDRFEFHVAANGAAHFQAIEMIMTDRFASREHMWLESEGFLAGYDPSMEHGAVDTIFDFQRYNNGNILPIYEAKHGAAGFAWGSITFEAHYVDGIPSVPAPGVFGVMGIGGLLAARRRR